MKPCALILLLAVVVVLLTGGCLMDTPQKKEPSGPVTPASTVSTAMPTSPAVVATISPQSPVVTMVVLVTTTEEIVSEAETEGTNLKIIKYHEERPEVGKLIIVGIAKNEGKTVIPRAEVQIKFYDANKNLITSTKTATDNFDAGGTWGFNLVYPGPDSGTVKSYKITIVQV